MHVALLIRALTVGGAERQLVALANGLVARGHRVSLLVFYANGGLASELDPRVELVDLRKRRRGDLTGFVTRFVRTLGRLRPDALYSWMQVPNVMSGLATWLPRAPTVIWGIRGTAIDPGSYDLARNLVDIGERKLSGRPAVIIGNAEATRRELIAHGVPASRIRVIANGIDTTRFQPDAAARSRVRHELAVDDDTTLIGAIGRYDPMKDHVTLLKAAAGFMPTHPTARLLVVGDGPDDYRHQLQKAARTLGLGDRVIWSGPRFDMAAVYNALDLCTLSSRFGEGFPNVLGEAMACGIPCVATDVGDVMQVVGDTGAIVPVSDPAALAQGWSALLSDATKARHQAGAQARAHIVANFALARMITETEAALASAIAEHGR
jgi:glycosyltransferase involved in cell wall biosynthesis